MLVEIPDPDALLGLAAAFVAGAGGLLLYHRLRPYVSVRPRPPGPGYAERLEYYERQLVDMKIRLDAMGMDDPGGEQAREPPRPAAAASGGAEREAQAGPAADPVPRAREAAPPPAYPSITEHVLRIITDRPMTSRDIQVTIGRTREHTSRLMKKLSDDGLVKRHTGSKPYTYSVTARGLESLGSGGQAAAAA